MLHIPTLPSGAASSPAPFKVRYSRGAIVPSHVRQVRNLPHSFVHLTKLVIAGESEGGRGTATDSGVPCRYSRGYNDRALQNQQIHASIQAKMVELYVMGDLNSLPIGLRIVMLPMETL